MYGSIEAMREAVEAAGFSCAPFAYSEFVPDPSVAAIEVAVCREGVANEGAIFALHVDARQVDQYVDQHVQSVGRDIVSVRGPNWSVICEPEFCPTFQDALGGVIATGPSRNG